MEGRVLFACSRSRGRWGTLALVGLLTATITVTIGAPLPVLADDSLTPGTVATNAAGEPVLVKADTVLVMPAYRHAAHRVFNAPEIRYTGTSAATTTVAANPLGNYQVHESRLAYRRIVASGVAADTAKKWWFLGDFKKAFAYMENWPITVTQAPQNSEADFSNDIVIRFKASERGAAAVLNPRYVVKSTG